MLSNHTVPFALPLVASTTLSTTATYAQLAPVA
jgi:hypothetical protein